MCEFVKSMLIILISISILFFGFSGSISNANENQLDNRLEEIRDKNIGVETDWGKLEAECLDLLKEYESPEDKGKIYAAIAFIYSEKGYDPLRSDITEQASKVAKYCKKALEYPLELVTACQIYSYWADALQIEYHDSVGEKFATARREIIIPCLKGLKLVLDNQTTREIQEAPPVGRYRIIGSPTDPVNQKLIRQREEEIAKRRNVILQNELIRFRQVLTQKCIYLYSREPYATDELKQLAGEILKNDDAVKDFITEVEAKIILP